jgi:hypothetical protein
LFNASIHTSTHCGRLRGNRCLSAEFRPSIARKVLSFALISKPLAPFHVGLLIASTILIFSSLSDKVGQTRTMFQPAELFKLLLSSNVDTAFRSRGKD